jgi:hypothetical protein
MKLLDYLRGLNRYAANNNIQRINLEEDKINLELKNRENSYYNIKFDNNVFSIDINSSLNELKELLKKLKIFLMINKKEDKISISKKLENKAPKLKLITVNLYKAASPEVDKEKLLKFDDEDNIENYKYIAFFDDTVLTDKQKTNLLNHLSKK